MVQHEGNGMNSTSGKPGYERARDKNLHVTFWGVQGSCPIFPMQSEVDEFGEHVAAFAAAQTLLDIADRMERGQVTPQMLRALAERKAAAEYQQKFGLPLLPVYGGDTTCVEITTCEENIIVLDMGTGLRDFSRRAAKDYPNRTLHIFCTHEHLDHRNGLPFAKFCFDRQNPYTVHLYGTRQVLIALDQRYGIYSHKLTAATHVDDPLDFNVISATFTGTEIRTPWSPPPAKGYIWPIIQAEKPIFVGQTSITPFDVCHGKTQCLGYKIQHGSSSFVFCTDHELRHGPDPADERQVKSVEAERRLLEYCRNADVAYFDGQYYLEEYKGLVGIGGGQGVPRIDWGHSCIEDVIDRVRQCNIRHTFIGHHDPERLWGQRLEIDRKLEQECEGKSYEIELAKAGDRVDL
jgi:hypothetical protein